MPQTTPERYARRAPAHLHAKSSRVKEDQESVVIAYWIIFLFFGFVFPVAFR